MLYSPHLLPFTTTTTTTTILLLPHISNFHFLKTSTIPSYFLSSQQFPARPHISRLLAQLSDSDYLADGPVELPFSFSSFISTDGDPSALQLATSVLLTGAVSVFLFRALRRRAKRAKELKFRSTGATKKSLKEEAIESLKAMTPIEENAPPSALQALLGGLSAGVIALIFYISSLPPLKLL